MNEALRTLRKLRLSGLARSLEIRLQEAAGHGLRSISLPVAGFPSRRCEPKHPDRAKVVC